MSSQLQKQRGFSIAIGMLVWGLVWFLAGCGGSSATNATSKEMVSSGVVRSEQNANGETESQTQSETEEEQTEEEQTEKSKTPDPLAYIYTTSSGAGFDIIDSLAPKCTACHRISTKGNRNGPGPNLNGLKDHAGSRVEGLSAREYVKQSILDPSAYIVEECPKSKCVDVMYKKYEEKITPEELDVLVSFLLTLDAEKTP